MKAYMSAAGSRPFRNPADLIESYLASGGGSVVSTRAAVRFVREHKPVMDHTDRELEELVLMHAVRRSRTVICDTSL